MVAQQIKTIDFDLELPVSPIANPEIELKKANATLNYSTSKTSLTQRFNSTMKNNMQSTSR